MGRDEVKDLDRVMYRNRRIAKKTSESAYIRDRNGDGKMEVVNNGNSVK